MVEVHRELENEIQILEHKLKEYPDGKLVCTSTGKYHQWFQSDGHKKTYIPKKNRTLAQQLAEKKYISSLLSDLNSEKRAIEFYLRHHREDVGKVKKVLIEMPEYQELLAPNFIPKSQELREWVNEPYDKNIKNPENLIYKGAFGNMLRSKSEVIIDTFLHMYKIPFRYECQLNIGGKIIYPDFTIRHPKSGKIYYWEHFGLMDDIHYARSANAKMELYIGNGIIPSIHLITTYETKEHPLSSEMVNKIIQYYFL